MDSTLRDHEAWIARVDRRGLFVTARALAAAGVHVTQPMDGVAASLRALASEAPRVADLPAFFRAVLDWPEELIVPAASAPAHLLAPTYALRSAEDPDAFVFLVAQAEPGAEPAEATARLERILRETGVGLGLFTDGYHFRLVYAPRGERAGSLTFRLPDLLDDETQPPLLGAFHMLASGPRLLSVPPERRLLALVRESRAYRIDRLVLEDLGAFERADLRFAPGINVFLGVNGTGKTHAMKAMYAVLQPLMTREALPELQALVLANKMASVFKPEDGLLAHLIRQPAKRARIVIEGAGQVDYRFHLHGLSEHVGSWRGSSSVLYIPTREVLAMYEGFIAAYQKRDLSFDETYFDLCVALGAAPLRGTSADEAAALAAPLDLALGGKPILRGGRFYRKNGDEHLEAHLLAEGLRKIAVLSHLLANGSLTADGILFWDEPEANLNPRLITVVADLLLDLASLGVQIFVTTHDYLLSHRLSLISEYQRRPDVPIRFFAFHRPSEGAGVRVDAGATLAELPQNPIVDEFTRHYDFERDLFDAPEGRG